MVFQDRNWTARPWRVEQEEVVDRGDSFDITLRARGTFDADAFTWAAIITGTADGTLTYTLRGESTSPFLRNRLGICVLHPMADYAGRACTIIHPDGSTTDSAFPDAISAHQPFVDIAGMDWPVPGGRARLDFAGDVFETEDHRNWSDASYKTYCTPITLPFPVEVAVGDVLSQVAALTISSDAPTPSRTRTETPVEVMVRDAPQPIPGLGVHLTDPEWSAAEAADLKALGLSHLHIDLDAGQPQAVAHLRSARDRARFIGARLLIALHVDEQPASDLAQELSQAADDIEGIWVFRSDEKVTARATVDAWRSRLGPDLPWGIGTNLYFTELNRQPPDTTGLAWSTFSTNPQVHAHDDRSVMQNTATLEVIAREVPRLAGRTRVHVGPVSLRPRFNPNATDPASDVSSTDLPADVDARQSTGYTAAWAALAMRGLSIPATITAVTLFDDLGWKGLRCRDTGPEDPAFMASPAERFPVYDVIQAIAGATHVLPTQSRSPEQVDAIVIEGPDSLRAIAVNLTDTPRQVLLTGAVESVIDLEPHEVKFIDLPGRAT